MSKYIDASKLKAEIERRKELLTPHKGQGVILCRKIIKQFDSLLSFIYTISQPIMKDDIIDEIRAEIERRFSEYNHDSNHHVQAAECASILDFLSTFESEKPVSYDLKEAAKHHSEQYRPHWPKQVRPAYDSFIAGAKWQEEQYEKEQADLFTIVALDAAQRAKEQMMKEAVEGEVMTNGFYPYEPRIVAPYPNCPYDFGDKVRVIFLPKEDEK